jgi:hypothetical protein
MAKARQLASRGIRCQAGPGRDRRGQSRSGCARVAGQPKAPSRTAEADVVSVLQGTFDPLGHDGWVMARSFSQFLMIEPHGPVGSPGGTNGARRPLWESGESGPLMRTWGRCVCRV